MRVGFGYDVHRLAEGRRLVLGGIVIPYDRGLLGHSDADVLLHAVMDALLGAAGLNDIGTHFPDTDSAYQGISSMILLQKTVELLGNSGFECNNVDCSIVAQQPKIAPYREKIRLNLAQALKLQPEQVNVKATTTEGLGFTGKGEGIAAYVVCTVRKCN